MKGRSIGDGEGRLSGPAEGPSVLLGQAYHLRFDPKLWAGQQPYPPLGSLYALSVLREAGFDVRFHDSMLAESEAEWAGALDRETPRFAVLYEDNFNYLTKMCLLRMREAAVTMIQAAKQRGCTVIVAGSDATDHPEPYLDAGADWVIAGEGDLTLRELLEMLSTGQPVKSVPGLVYRGEAGETVRTIPRPILRNLDTLPLPAWDLIDFGRYRALWKTSGVVNATYALNLVTSRGCPYHCNWCAKPIWGQRYNARSPESVVEEMAWLHEHAGMDYVWFMDDMFGVKPRWTARFADSLEARGLRIPFKCLNRADLILRDGDIEALARAGCDVVWMGVESGSQKILDAMDKGTKIEDVIEASRRLHEAGIRVGFFLQFGYPGETREDIEKTFDLVRQCRPEEIGASVSYPLPGTKFYDMVREQLGQRQHWVDSDDLAMLYAGPYTTEFYRTLHRMLHRVHRSQRSVDRLKHAVRQPARLRPALLKDAAALAYHQAALPFTRLKLNRLARAEHEGVAPVSGLLTPEQAAIPTESDVKGG